MAYFTQAGAHQAYSQSDFQKGDRSSKRSFQQQSDASSSGYSGPGTETYAQSAYDSNLYAAPSGGFAPQPSEYEPPKTQRDWSRSFGMLGGVASVILTIGAVYWGYDLITRDVTGIPVVRASEGPLRVSPESPGGRQADNQGLAVNDVAANGTAAAPADRLTLAPAELDLSEDDKTFAQLSQIETLQASEDLQLETAQVIESVPNRVAQGVQSGDIDALVAQLTEGAEPIQVPLAGDVPAIQTASAQIVQPQPLTEIEPVVASNALGSAPRVRVSLRPVLRPVSLAAAPVQAAVQPSANEVDPSTLPAGTRLAQLGAYDSADVARTEWNRISARFSDYLDGKQRVIQRAEKGGRTFYRLRAMGFEDLSAARRFCAALVAGRADCIPVTTR